ncbi:uncharacterized protein LOC131632312 [Vicia villosa]|uniref:uncharacterized protein LOC131632312 n=1 Tax=Vicia villosa TaxID=3911 RepID=UPI00273C766A|nr:uncharacterized protein LOC131632312 [Vicia villosa]
MEEVVGDGSCSYKIKEKFKLLKERLKWWNGEVFGWVNLKIEKAVEDMNFCNDQLQLVVDSEGVLSDNRKKAKFDFWNTLKLRECILKQKSRAAWLNEGDTNTNFFHRSVKERRKRNSLVGIESPLGRVETVEGMKGEVRRFFEAKYKESPLRRPVLDGIEFNYITTGEAEELEHPFTTEELKDAVWSCDGDKCPGLDR